MEIMLKQSFERNSYGKKRKIISFVMILLPYVTVLDHHWLVMFGY